MENREIGERLRSIRNEKGMTIEDVTNAMRESSFGFKLKRIEAGESNITQKDNPLMYKKVRITFWSFYYLY